MLAFRYQCDANDGCSQIFPAKIGEIENATAFVDHVLSAHHCTNKTIAEINIIVDEIVSNIARYSRSETAKLTCQIIESKIVLCFADSGLKYNLLEQEAADITASADDRSIGGLGIQKADAQINRVLLEIQKADAQMN